MTQGNNHYSVFFDFDNTIASIDVLDRLLELFAKDQKWRDLEEKWQKGEIGSRDCLKGQMACVTAEEKEIVKFLQSIKLDSGFKDLLAYIRKKEYPCFVVSDSFEYLIAAILKHYNVDHLKIYANHLKFEGGRLKADFLNGGKNCHKCANCKKEKLLMHKNSGKAIYIGDGLSDICAAQEADIVFAKDKLLAHGREKGFDWIPFENLSNVKEYLQAYEN